MGKDSFFQQEAISKGENFLFSIIKVDAGQSHFDLKILA
jgi:hypothetical protein